MLNTGPELHVVGQQAITWTNTDQVLWRNMRSLSHQEWTTEGLILTQLRQQDR